MPIPIASVAEGAMSVGTNMFNALSQNHQNKQSRKWSEKIYERSKNDNLEFWRLQNEYNTPAAQMQRFKAAGLNPNLIYGQGNPGNAGGISSPDSPTPEFRPAQFSELRGLDKINQMYDLDIKKQQVNNLATQNEVLEAEADLKRVNVERARFDLELESEARPYSMDYRKERNRSLSTSTDIAIRRDVREAVGQSYTIAEAIERTLNLSEQRKNMRSTRIHTDQDTQRIKKAIELMSQDGELKRLDIQLRELGLTPKSPQWQIIGSRIVNDIIGSPTKAASDIIKDAYEGIKGLYNDYNDDGSR